MNDALGVVKRQGDYWSIRYVRHIDVSAQELWDSLTQPERIARWMQTESMSLEPNVGGAVHYYWGGSDRCDGIVTDFDPPRTLAYSWNEGANTSSVRFDIVEREGGVELTLEHRTLTTDEIKGVGPGWHAHLDYLDAVLHHANFEFSPRFESLQPLYERVLQQS